MESPRRCSRVSYESALTPPNLRASEFANRRLRLLSRAARAAERDGHVTWTEALGALRESLRERKGSGQSRQDAWFAPSNPAVSGSRRIETMRASRVSPGESRCREPGP